MSFVHLYGKADIEDAVAAGANEKPMGCVPLLFEDAVKAVFISAVRAYVEFVLELDFLYFSIHYITFFFLYRELDIFYSPQRTQRAQSFFVLLFSVAPARRGTGTPENNKKHALRAGG